MAAITVWELRLALRGLGRAPILTITAVVAISFGVVVTLVVFGVSQRLAFPAMPVSAANRVYLVQDVRRTAGGRFLTPRQLLGFRAAVQSLTSVGAFRAGLGARHEMAAEIDGRSVQGLQVSSNAFRVLGIEPILGTFFSEGDAANETAVVISEALWRRHFRSDPSVVGKTLTVDRQSRVVIGVAPAGFWFPYPGLSFWVALPLSGLNSDDASITAFGRLRREVNADQLVAEVRVLQESLDTTSDRLRRQSWDVTSLPDVSGAADAPIFALLVAVVTALLVVTCVSVSTMLLARTAQQMPATAVRAALGASRAALLQGPLLEGGMIALLAIIVGTFGALAVGGVLARMTESVQLSEALAQTGPRTPVVVFCVVLSILVCAICVLPSALFVDRFGRSDRLKAVMPAARHGSRIRTSLVVIQILSSVVLIQIAWVAIRGAVDHWAWAPPFRAKGLLITELSDSKARRTNLGALVLGLTADPRVTAVAALATASPIGGAVSTDSPLPAESEGSIYRVTVNYFAMLGVDLVNGRSLGAGALGAGEAVVDDALARRLWGTPLAALGRRLKLGVTTSDATVVTVVGVCRRFALSPDNGGERAAQFTGAAYVAGQFEELRGATLFVRVREGARSPDDVLVRFSDAGGSPPLRFLPVLDEIERRLAPYRFLAASLGVVGLVALMISVLALYGITDHMVISRTTELALRAALGASRGRISRMVVMWALRPLAAGTVIGTLIGWGAIRVLDGSLHSGLDFAEVVMVSCSLTVVTLIACLRPFIRASRQDLSTVLRHL